MTSFERKGSAESLDADELLARVRELEQENADLRESRSDPEPRLRQRRSFRWRTVVSAVFIVVASVLVPAGIVTGWTKAQLVSEADFVETLAPLAAEPEVQREVTVQVAAALEQELGVPELVDATFDGLTRLDLPEEAKEALNLLRKPAVQGAHSVITDAVAAFVGSEAFAETWRFALAASHRALVAAASGTAGDGALTVDGGGGVELHLGPVISAVKAALVAQGIDMASGIPEINPAIVVAHAEALEYVGPVYQIAVAAGWVIPFLSLALYVAAVALARKKHIALLGGGIGMILGGGALLAALGIGAVGIVAAAPQLGVSASAVGVIASHVVAGMFSTASSVIVFGALLVLFGWFSGSSAFALAVRGVIGSGTTRVAHVLGEQGFDGGRFSAWLLAHRAAVRIVLGALVLAALIVLPTGVAPILWMVLVALVVCLIIEVLEACAIQPSAVGAGEGTGKFAVGKV